MANSNSSRGLSGCLDQPFGLAITPANPSSCWSPLFFHFLWISGTFCAPSSLWDIHVTVWPGSQWSVSNQSIHWPVCPLYMMANHYHHGYFYKLCTVWRANIRADTLHTYGTWKQGVICLSSRGVSQSDPLSVFKIGRGGGQDKSNFAGLHKILYSEKAVHQRRLFLLRKCRRFTYRWLQAAQSQVKLKVTERIAPRGILPQRNASVPPPQLHRCELRAAEWCWFSFFDVEISSPEFTSQVCGWIYCDKAFLQTSMKKAVFMGGFELDFYFQQRTDRIRPAWN